jgi:hypothetical protein
MSKDFAAIENIRKELARIEKSMLLQQDPAQTIIHSLLDAQGKAMAAMTEVIRKASAEMRNREYEHMFMDMPEHNMLDSTFNPLEKDGWELMQVIPPTGDSYGKGWRVWVRRPKVRVNHGSFGGGPDKD